MIVSRSVALSTMFSQPSKRHWAKWTPSTAIKLAKYRSCFRLLSVSTRKWLSSVVRSCRRFNRLFLSRLRWKGGKRLRNCLWKRSECKLLWLQRVWEVFSPVCTYVNWTFLAARQVHFTSNTLNWQVLAATSWWRAISKTVFCKRLKLVLALVSIQSNWASLMVLAHRWLEDASQTMLSTCLKRWVTILILWRVSKFVHGTKTTSRR